MLYDYHIKKPSANLLSRWPVKIKCRFDKNLFVIQQKLEFVSFIVKLNLSQQGASIKIQPLRFKNPMCFEKPIT